MFRSVLLVVAMSGCGWLNPAGAKLAEAREREAAGAFEEALAAYESIGIQWPEAPEAKDAVPGVQSSLIGMAKSAKAAGDYLKSGELADRAAKAGLATLPSELMTTRDFYANTIATPPSFLQFQAAVANAERDPDPKFAPAIVTWACGHVELMDGFKACTATSTIGDITALETATTACASVEAIPATCESGPAVTAIAASLALVSEAKARFDATCAEGVANFRKVMASVKEEDASIQAASDRVEERWLPEVAAGYRHALAGMLRDNAAVEKRTERLQARVTAECTKMYRLECPDDVKAALAGEMNRETHEDCDRPD
jgi:hypothetical protein